MDASKLILAGAVGLLIYKIGDNLIADTSSNSNNQKNYDEQQLNDAKKEEDEQLNKAKENYDEKIAELENIAAHQIIPVDFYGEIGNTISPDIQGRLQYRCFFKIKNLSAKVLSFYGKTISLTIIGRKQQFGLNLNYGTTLYPNQETDWKMCLDVNAPDLHNIHDIVRDAFGYDVVNVFLPVRATIGYEIGPEVLNRDKKVTGKPIVIDSAVFYYNMQKYPVKGEVDDDKIKFIDWCYWGKELIEKYKFSNKSDMDIYYYELNSSKNNLNSSEKLVYNELTPYYSERAKNYNRWVGTNGWNDFTTLI